MIVPWISTPHSDARAQLRKAEAPFEPFVLVRQKAAIEVHVVGDEDAVAHERHQAVRDLVEHGGAPNHLVGDPGQLHDPRWNRAPVEAPVRQDEQGATWLPTTVLPSKRMAARWS